MEQTENITWKEIDVLDYDDSDIFFDYKNEMYRLSDYKIRHLVAQFMEQEDGEYVEDRGYPGQVYQVTSRAEYTVGDLCREHYARYVITRRSEWKNVSE